MNKKKYFDTISYIQHSKNVDNIYSLTGVFDDDIYLTAKAIRHFTDTAGSIYYIIHCLENMKVWALKEHVEKVLSCDIDKIEKWKESTHCHNQPTLPTLFNEIEKKDGRQNRIRGKNKKATKVKNTLIQPSLF